MYEEEKKRAWRIAACIGLTIIVIIIATDPLNANMPWIFTAILTGVLMTIAIVIGHVNGKASKKNNANINYL